MHSINWNAYLPWLVQLSALVGVVWPFVVALFLQQHWSSQTKRYVAVALALIAAIIVTAAKGDLTLANLAGSFVALQTTTHVFYESLWKKPANQLEVATTIDKEPEPEDNRF